MNGKANPKAAPCERVLALIPAYTVGAATPDEGRFVEEMLADCPEALEALMQTIELTDALHGLGENTDLQVLPTHNKQDNEQGHVRLVKLQKQRRLDQGADERPTAVPRSNRRVGWLAAVSALAALLAVVISGIVSLYWTGEISDLRDSQDQLAASLNRDTTTGDMLLAGGATFHRELVATDVGLPQSRAAVVWDPATGVGALYVSGLPVLAPELRYQLWLVREDKEISLGQFVVDGNGEAIMLFQADEPIESYDAMGVSTEPASGSAKPTTPHLVIGEI